MIFKNIVLANDKALAKSFEEHKNSEQGEERIPLPSESEKEEKGI